MTETMRAKRRTKKAPGAVTTPLKTDQREDPNIPPAVVEKAETSPIAESKLQTLPKITFILVRRFLTEISGKLIRTNSKGTKKVPIPNSLSKFSLSVTRAAALVKKERVSRTAAVMSEKPIIEVIVFFSSARGGFL